MEKNLNDNIDLIKKSFEATPSKAPDFIWENLDKQLYVDRVWLKLKVQLDRIQANKRRVKTLILSAAVLILTLLITGSVYYLQKDSSGNAMLAYKEINKLQPLKSDSDYTTVSNAIFPKPISEPKNKVVNNLTNEKAKNNLTTKTTLLNKSSNDSTGLSNILTDNSKASYSLVLTKSNFSKEIEIVKEDTLSKLTSLQTGLLASGEINPLEFSTIKDFNPDTLNSILPFIPMKNQIGIIYALNSTMIINNEFSESNREGSMLNLVPSVASSYGLIYNYNFSFSNAISAELFFVSKQNQSINLYSNGRYYRKTTELSYAKAVIAYQKNINFRWMKPESWYYLKTGIYYSILTKNNIYYARNDERIDLPTSIISNDDYGVKFSIGRETCINNIVLGGGLQSEYGLKNIFKGDEKVPSYFNRTNNFSHGFFLTIKFRY